MAVLQEEQQSRSGEGVHLLVVAGSGSGRESMDTSRLPCAAGKTWLFSLVLLSPCPSCPFLLITAQPKALLPQEALPTAPLSDFPALAIYARQFSSNYIHKGLSPMRTRVTEKHEARRVAGTCP